MYGFFLDNICPRYNYLNICNLRVQKNLNTKKMAFKVVQMKFLAMHITNNKLSFNIYVTDVAMPVRAVCKTSLSWPQKEAL